VDALVPGSSVALVPGSAFAEGPQNWLGACGKTQVAVVTAESLWRSGAIDLLIWINATSRTSVLSSFVQASVPATGIEPTGTAESIVARFVSWLGETRQPWLVVFDDLSESVDLDGLWPEGPVGRVLVTSPQGELTPLGLIPKFQYFQVVGIFHSGFYQYDSSMAFTSLADAQRLFGEPDVVSVISFKVDDLYHADQIGRSIEQAAGPGFLTTNWMEQNRELFRALHLERIVTFIVIGLIVCVAALNILTALTMMVMEKTRDIAVMMSFGVQPRQVRMIFLLQGLLIGFTGTFLGLIGGYGLSWLGGHYRFSLSAAVYSIDYLPFAARWTDGLIVAGVAMAVSLLATLYPSGSASRILPAEALRYE